MYIFMCVFNSERKKRENEYFLFFRLNIMFHLENSNNNNQKLTVVFWGAADIGLIFSSICISLHIYRSTKCINLHIYFNNWHRIRAFFSSFFICFAVFVWYWIWCLLSLLLLSYCWCCCWWWWWWWWWRRSRRRYLF